MDVFLINPLAQGPEGAVAVTAQWKPIDEYFFTEWKNRRSGDTRSLERARRVLDRLEIKEYLPPILTVVGSKGKGTAALFASATLSGSGLKTVTVTSPPMIQNNERIRLDGEQISDQQLEELGKAVRLSANSIPKEGNNYLSPTGSFTLAGALFANQVGADVLVMEEGLGGKSDEISLFSPLVVTATEIFPEHQDILGESLTEIANDLLGVVTDQTRTILSCQQSPPVINAINSLGKKSIILPTLPDEFSKIDSWPLGLSSANAVVGTASGIEMLKLMKAEMKVARIVNTLNTVKLPGRLSVHRTSPKQQWVVDGAITKIGVDEALRQCRRIIGTPDAILVSFPDTKNVQECYEPLQGLNIIPITSGESYLTFNSKFHPTRPTSLENAIKSLSDKFDRILCIGTMSFVGDVLNHVGTDMSRIFAVPDV